MHHAISSRFSFFNYAILVAVIFVVLSACATPNELDYVEVKERTLHSGDEIPATSGTTIVSFSGGAIGDDQTVRSLEHRKEKRRVSSPPRERYRRRIAARNRATNGRTRRHQRQ